MLHLVDRLHMLHLLGLDLALNTHRYPLLESTCHIIVAHTPSPLHFLGGK